MADIDFHVCYSVMVVLNKFLSHNCWFLNESFRINGGLNCNCALLSETVSKSTIDQAFLMYNLIGSKLLIENRNVDTERALIIKVECRSHERSGGITASTLHATDANMNAT